MIALWAVLRPFLPYIVGAVAAIGAVWGVHHHGYRSGVDETEAKYAAATRAAQARVTEIETQLATANRTLAARSGVVAANQVKVAQNEKARADALIADLRRQLHDAAGGGVSGTDAATRCADVAAAGAGAAVANANAARVNAAQVDGLQLWAGDAMRLCGNRISPETAKRLTDAERRFAERERAMLND